MTEEEEFDQQLPEWSQELQDEWLRTLPLFVSIPRSGCNWLQAVMELYFGRHRAGKGATNPSWLKTKWESPMWMHTHDNFGNPNEGKLATDNPTIFLWREPVDVIYSLLKLHKTPLGAGPVIADKTIRFAKLYKKWTSKNNVLVVKYEDVLTDPMKQMKRISEWFDKPFNEQKAKWAFEVAGNKKKTNEKNGLAPHFKNKESGTKSYELGREDFKNNWGEEVAALFLEVLKKYDN